MDKKLRTTNINVYLAAEAFLYLPIHLAEKLGLFETENLIVKISAPKKNNRTGDDFAIEAMLNDTGLAYSISSASPLLSPATKNRFSNSLVIASLINKLPFWALNHKKETYKDEESLVYNYDQIIHLDRNHKEGYYLGERLKKSKNSIETILAKEFGTELDELKEFDDRTFTISAAIEKIALELNASNSISINYRFSENGIGNRFLTTAIITKKSESKYRRLIDERFLKCIQKAIFIIYSSPVATKYYISKDGGIFPNEYANNKYNLSSKETATAMEIIRDEELYPRDMNICLKSWSESMKALEETELKHSKSYSKFRTKIQIRRAYLKFVDNSIVHSSERALAKELGINRNTFSFMVDSKIVRSIYMITHIAFIWIYTVYTILVILAGLDIYMYLKLQEFTILLGLIPIIVFGIGHYIQKR